MIGDFMLPCRKCKGYNSYRYTDGHFQMHIYLNGCLCSIKGKAIKDITEKDNCDSFIPYGPDENLLPMVKCLTCKNSSDIIDVASWYKNSGDKKICVFCRKYDHRSYIGDPGTLDGRGIISNIKYHQTCPSYENL